MYCKKCGMNVDDGVNFCPGCGEQMGQQMTGNGGVAASQSQPSDTNGMAVAGFVLSFFFALLGLIFSCVGLAKSKQMDGKGKGLAIAGIIISIVSMVLMVVWYILIIPFITDTFNTIGI